MAEFKTCTDKTCEHHGRHAHAKGFKARKRPEKWWEVYRAIFEKLHHRKSDGFEYSSSSGQAADAAFDALGLPKFID